MFCSQDVIQGKQAIASALESAEPALAFDKRDLAFVVENVLDFVGDEQWVVTIIGALKALHTAGVESLTLRHSVSKIRSELDHRQHSMHTITEVLGRWFRGKSLVQVAELLVSTIERFCPDMECKDLLTNPAPPKGYDNLDILLQTEQILLEMGAHLYLETSKSLLDDEHKTHSPAFKELLDHAAPGYDNILTDKSLSGLKQQLQAYKRWRRLFVWCDVRMIVADLPLHTKLLLITRLQNEVLVTQSALSYRRVFHVSANIIVLPFIHLSCIFFV